MSEYFIIITSNLFVYAVIESTLLCHIVLCQMECQNRKLKSVHCITFRSYRLIRKKEKNMNFLFGEYVGILIS
jgi:hypothetical protein